MINGTDHKYGHVGKEENDELGLKWHDFGARNYEASLGRFFGVDPLAEMDYSWTPFRYGYNNPINYIDPDGLWELRISGNKEDGFTVTLHADDGDNLETLSEQTGFSIEKLSEFYDEKTLKKLKNGETETLDTFGGHLKNLSNLLSLDGDKKGKEGRKARSLLNSNCFSASCQYADNYDVTKGLNQGSSIRADRTLRNKYTATAKGRWGDIIRYAKDEGYSGDYRRDPSGQLRPEVGWEIGGAYHFANFLLQNDKGIMIFTKNGQGTAFQIIYADDKTLTNSYGNQMRLNPGAKTKPETNTTAIYTQKKD